MLCNNYVYVCVVGSMSNPAVHVRKFEVRDIWGVRLGNSLGVEEIMRFGMVRGSDFPDDFLIDLRSKFRQIRWLKFDLQKNEV